MCTRIECSTCHKPTWTGCGAHVNQVLGDVPRADRCSCRETARQARAATTSARHTTAPHKSWLKKLLSK